MHWRLVVTYPEGHGDVYSVTTKKALLGSSSECQLGIQAPEAGVEDRHVMFSVEGSRMFAKNLGGPGTVRINGKPLETNQKQAFGCNDDLAIGGTVCVRVRLLPLTVEEEKDRASSPDGTATVANEVRNLVHVSGWMGNRMVLEKIVKEIDPGEAEKAEGKYRKGQRALRWSMVVVIALAVLAWIFADHQWFELKQAVYCIDLYVALFCVLALTARFHIRNAGRILFFAWALLFGAPPRAAWMDHFSFMQFWMLFFAGCFFVVGWLIDIGAGCVFDKSGTEADQKRDEADPGRKDSRPAFAWRYLLLMLACVLLCGIQVWPYFLEIPRPGSPWWYYPLPVFALACFRFFQTHSGESLKEDAGLVAELAACRAGRRLRARISTVLLLSTPLILLLGALGTRERIVWDDTREDENLLVAELDTGEKTAWYWTSRGRYLEKSDFGARKSSIYQIPVDDLLAPEGVTEADTEDISVISAGAPPSRRASRLAKRETKIGRDLLASRPGTVLSGTGRELCRKIAAVQTDATNVLYYADLKEALAPYRVGPSETEKFAEGLLGTTVPLVVFLEEADSRETYDSGPHPKLHTAVLYQGAPHGGELQAYTARNAQRKARVIGAKAIPALVLVAWATLFLWKRGGDSHLGFWLGVALSFSALFLYSSPDDPFIDGPMMEYQLWHLALHHSVGSLLSAWFALLTIVTNPYLYYAFLVCAPPALFVLLCWPSLPHGRQNALAAGDGGERGHRRDAFVWRFRRTCLSIGKFIAVLGVIGMVCCASYSISGQSRMLTRCMAMLVVGVLGACLRQTGGGKGEPSKVVAGEGSGSEQPTAAEAVLDPESASPGVKGKEVAKKKPKARKNYTEAPYLGWEFFAAYFLLDLSVALPVTASYGLDPWIPAAWLDPLPWLKGTGCWVGLISGTAALAGGGFFLALCLRKNFLSVLTPNGFSIALLAFSIPIFTATCEAYTADLFQGTFLQSQLGERILSIAVIILILSPLWKLLQRFSRYILQPNLPRVEKDVKKTLENMLDDPETCDIYDAIHKCFKEDLKLKQYVLYTREKDGKFWQLLWKGLKGTEPDCFTMSRYLRDFLGQNPQAIDLTRVEHEEKLFFQSFELWKIRRKLFGRDCTGHQQHYCLPICLGPSVRAILVTSVDAKDGANPDSEAFCENMNTLGLASIASEGGSPVLEET